MGDTFQAGSVVAELRTEMQQFDQGFKRATKTVQDFGNKSRQAATVVEQSGKSMASSFAEVDRKSIQMMARLSRVTGAILALHAVMDTFTSPDKGVTKFSAGMKAAGAGLTTFAGIALAIPHPIGIAIASFAGLTSAVVSYGKAMGEALTLGEEYNKQQAKLKQERFDATIERAFRGRTMSGSSLAAADLEEQIKNVETQIKRDLIGLEGIRGFNNRGELGRGFADMDEQRGFIERATADLDKAITSLGDKRRALALTEARKDREAMEVENRQLAQQTEMLINAGLVDPIEAVRASSTAAEAALKKLLEQQTALEKIAPGLGGALGTDLGLALDKAKRERMAFLDAQEVRRQADNFGSAIGEGLRRGILDGESAMETLANVGRNLFENMVNDLTTNLQKALSTGFEAIAGAGGSALSTLFTAGLGIAGAVLSKRGGVSESFNPVESQITSTQAVRGIVAGPTSVSIATVAEDIGRAMEPVRELLASIDGTLRRMEGRGSSTRGGQGFAGSVATA